MSSSLSVFKFDWSLPKWPLLLALPPSLSVLGLAAAFFPPSLQRPADLVWEGPEAMVTSKGVAHGEM